MYKFLKMNKISQDKPIIFFDGVCNLCNGFIQFIIKNDRNDYFRFSALNSKLGKLIRHKYKLENNSIILYTNGKVYTKSDAIFRIYKNLHGSYSFLYFGIYLPKKLRDRIYKTIAKNRYRLFGKTKECWITNHELTKKFL